ncbi:hypothetical protein [Aneurinibacillus aneurinilyticus]
MPQAANIPAQQVRKRQMQGKKLNVVDAREDEEVAVGRIPGAE